MNLLTNLIINLENDLSKRKIYEPIILRSSNVANFDFQINNLVKLEKNNEVKDIKKSFTKIYQSETKKNNR